MSDLNLNKNEFHYHSSGESIWGIIKSFLYKKKILDKNSARILFIDDNKFPVMNSLGAAGYTIKYIKDIKNIDITEVQDAHLIFIDYKGVGKNLSQNKEGVGVAKMLREKYEGQKYVVLYTAENLPNELISEIKSAANENMAKDSDTTLFIEAIERGLTSINKN